jgi:hypothetical protein
MGTIERGTGVTSCAGGKSNLVGKSIAAQNPPPAGPVWIKVGDTIDLGMIDKDAALIVRCLSAPIRLPQGVGGARGHGLLHIQDNKNRMNEIRGLDYKTAALFVADIAKNWTKIARANELNRLVLVHSIRGYDLRLIVQIYAKRCWSVVTAIPGRSMKAADILFERRNTAG